MNQQKQISERPIGVFDSGIGGLTLARGIAHLLPNENLMYFGDTAHLPYGDKSTAAIQAYSIKICDMLLEQNCKVIVIACNSASAAAFDLVKEYVGSRAHVLNVIDPVVNHIREHYPTKVIGLIGTKKTVSSNIYKKKLDELNLDIQYKALATPLLVPMIEEGFCKGKITHELIHEYLSRSEIKGIEALILGCTHYPLIKDSIADFYKDRVDIIDSSDIVAQALKGFLEFHNLCNRQTRVNLHFYISDYTENFVNSARQFFGDSIYLEHYPLWE